MRLEVLTREPKSLTERAPLLFVHGSCHAAWCWEEHFLEYFAGHGYASHALSLRGHGNSEGPNNLRWTSVKDYVRDVEQVAEGLPRAPVVIGHSLGGLVVQKYLEKHRAPAAVLVAPSPASGMLVAGFPLFLKRPMLFTKSFLTLDVRVLYGTPALIREMLFSADVEKAKLESYATRFGEESFRACMEMMFSLPKPRRVKSPMLVLGAANDIIVGPRAIRGTARAYGADVQIFPDMAHDMMLERKWEQVAHYILEWLQKRGL